MIEHPPGEEVQFDWVELPDPPAGWGIGGHAHLLVGALAHSGRWRAVLAESEDFPHLVQALDQVLRKLGGTARRWRFDRMATVCYPSSGQVTPTFAEVAKFYGVQVAICLPRRGNRKGVVEKANHSAVQRSGARSPTVSASSRPGLASTTSSPSGWTSGAAASTASR